MDVDMMVKRARVLSSPTRVVVWCCLGTVGMYPTDIATTLGLAPSTITHHLSVLRDAGLVTVTRQGRCSLYKWSREKWTIVSEKEMEAYMEEQHRLVEPSQRIDQVLT